MNYVIFQFVVAASKRWNLGRALRTYAEEIGPDWVQLHTKDIPKVRDILNNHGAVIAKEQTLCLSVQTVQ